MANEITVLEGDGSFRFTLFFIFPIATPKQIGTPPANVVPTPATNPDGSSALPSLADDILAGAEKTAFDAGTSAWTTIQFRKAAGLTNAQLAAVAQDRYAEELAAFNQQYAQTYIHAGTRINA